MLFFMMIMIIITLYSCIRLYIYIHMHNSPYLSTYIYVYIYMCVYNLTIWLDSSMLCNRLAIWYDVFHCVAPQGVQGKTIRKPLMLNHSNYLKAIFPANVSWKLIPETALNVPMPVSTPPSSFFSSLLFRTRHDWIATPRSWWICSRTGYSVIRSLSHYISVTLLLILSQLLIHFHYIHGRVNPNSVAQIS